MFTVALIYMLLINEPAIVYRPNGGFGVGRGSGGLDDFQLYGFQGREENRERRGHQSSPTECKRGDYTKVTAINCQ